MGYDLVIPVFNEKNIINLIEYILKNCQKLNKIIICYDDINDITIKEISKSKYKDCDKLILKKNFKKGPCEAVKTGFYFSDAQAIIVYPADDFDNGKLLDKIYKLYLKGFDVVCPSRFIEGGIIKNCPILKFIIVKIVSLSLFYLTKVKIKDPTNGFRMFSKKFLDKTKIESSKGFSYSLELLIKARIQKLKIIEIPSIWIERKDRKSSFKIFKWSFAYLKWYLYSLKI